MKLPFISLFLIFALCCCKKKTDITLAVNYTESMGGIRTWSGHSDTLIMALGKHILWQINDTALPITVIDATTVQFMDHTFRFDPRYSTATTYYFIGHGSITYFLNDKKMEYGYYNAPSIGHNYYASVSLSTL